MDQIFTHFISRGDPAEAKQRLAFAAWFTEEIPAQEFEGDERLFWEYLVFSTQLNAPIAYKYLQVWLDTELREVLHRTNVHVKGCESLRFEDPLSFETAYRTTRDVLSDDFNVLETMESDVDDFKIEVSSFFTKKRRERLTQALAQTYDRLNQTDNVEDASDYVSDTVDAIQDIYDITKLEDLDIRVPADDDHKVIMEKVSDSGLPAIDTDSGGIHYSQLFGIEAQPGTGKTRFALGTYVYRALTIYHKNVLFFSLEQLEDELEAMLVAAHVFWMFNIQITDQMILQGTVPTELQPKVDAAKYDLFHSGKYGKFVGIEADLYLETFVTRIRTLDKLKGPFDLICIDYMGLIESKPEEFKREPTEAEIIKKSFKKFKRYLRRSRKAGIAISQFNKEGIQAGKNDKTITTDMAQGGMAVYRNTDYNIAISMTDTMRAQQKRRFSQPKVRLSAGFPSFIVDTRLGFCYFKQVVQRQV